MIEMISTRRLIQDHCSRFRSQIGRLARQFQEQFGFPDNIAIRTPPHDPGPLLVILDYLAKTGGTIDVVSAVCRTFVADVMDTKYVFYSRV